jgi:NodT family efflux transporter outer membrane factor (OMF) lipoprotein
MKMKYSKTILLSAAASLLMTGCMHDIATPQQATKGLKQSIAKPSQYQSSYLGGKVRDNWLRSFRDPVLNRLVAQAQKNNPDLKVTATRIEKAAAVMHLTQSDMMPQLNLTGNYTLRSWKASDQYDRGSIAMAVSWEPDIWGKLANQTARDTETMLSMAADYEYARQSLSASTAKAWFMLGSDKMIYDFNKKVVDIEKEARKILVKRADIGQGNQRDVHMISGMLAEAQNNLITSLSAKENDTRALEILLGKYPANALKAKRLAAVPPRIPTGIPASLLNRRPDVIAAQYRVASAFHNVEAVKLLRLPSINLGVQIGYDVLRNTMTKLLGGLFMPVADAGAIQAQIDAATADQKAAIEQYRSTVLKAYKEVEDALALEKQYAERYKYIKSMVKEYKTAYDLTYQNYKIGQGNFIDVLSVQTKWIYARIAKVQIQRDRLINRVNLNLALGGSFERR